MDITCSRSVAASVVALRTDIAPRVAVCTDAAPDDVAVRVARRADAAAGAAVRAPRVATGVCAVIVLRDARVVTGVAVVRAVTAGVTARGADDVRAVSFTTVPLRGPATVRDAPRVTAAPVADWDAVVRDVSRDTAAPECDADVLLAALDARFETTVVRGDAPRAAARAVSIAPVSAAAARSASGAIIARKIDTGFTIPFACILILAKL